MERRRFSRFFLNIQFLHLLGESGTRGDVVTHSDAHSNTLSLCLLLLMVTSTGGGLDLRPTDRQTDRQIITKDRLTVVDGM